MDISLNKHVANFVEKMRIMSEKKEKVLVMGIMDRLRDVREVAQDAERTIMGLVTEIHDLKCEIAEVIRVLWRSRKMVIETHNQQVMYDNWLRKLGNLVRMDVDKIDEDVQ